MAKQQPTSPMDFDPDSVVPTQDVDWLEFMAAERKFKFLLPKSWHWPFSATKLVGGQQEFRLASMGRIILPHSQGA
eukprot:1850166-Lingulodinium_polyedra.AAC.1